uniref:Uncharacterized protein n=1 Tax=viral metagenome TaxID=1070528 RepID=A0A6C0HI03_9ZZZZ
MSVKINENLTLVPGELYYVQPLIEFGNQRIDLVVRFNGTNGDGNLSFNVMYEKHKLELDAKWKIPEVNEKFYSPKQIKKIVIHSLDSVAAQQITDKHESSKLITDADLSTVQVTTSSGGKSKHKNKKTRKSNKNKKMRKSNKSKKSNTKHKKL